MDKADRITVKVIKIFVRKCKIQLKEKYFMFYEVCSDHWSLGYKSQITIYFLDVFQFFQKLGQK